MEFKRLEKEVGFGMAAVLHFDGGLLPVVFFDDLPSEKLCEVLCAGRKESGAYEEAFKRLANKKLNLAKWSQIYESAAFCKKDERLADLAARKMLKRAAVSDMGEICSTFHIRDDEKNLALGVARFAVVATTVDEWLRICYFVPSESAEKAQALKKIAEYELPSERWLKIYRDLFSRDDEQLRALCVEKVAEQNHGYDEWSALGSRVSENDQAMYAMLLAKRTETAQSFEQCAEAIACLDKNKEIGRVAIDKAMRLASGLEDWVRLFSLLDGYESERAAVVERLVEFNADFDYWVQFKGRWSDRHINDAMMRRLANNFQHWSSLRNFTGENVYGLQMAETAVTFDELSTGLCYIHAGENAALFVKVFGRLVAAAKSFNEWLEVYRRTSTEDAVRKQAEDRMIALAVTVAQWQDILRVAKNVEVQTLAKNKMLELAKN